MSGIPYLGSKISLISKSEIRYEGILVDVNPQDSTITFEQVRFFGTEGRRPADEIAPMDRVFDCVVFRSADIKDLQVYETPAAVAPEVEKEKEPEFPDPAVVSFANTAKSGFQYQAPKQEEEVKMPKVNNYASAAAQTQQQGHEQSQGQQGQTKSFSTRNNQNSNYHGSNTHHNNNNYNRQGRAIVVPKSEFDFSQSNAKFSKDELTASNPSNPEEQTAPSYNKNLSFFDDISCQANTESTRFADRNRTERNLNMETFGQAAPPRKNGQRGGRGRGGYSRGGAYTPRGGHNNTFYKNNSSANANNPGGH